MIPAMIPAAMLAGGPPQPTDDEARWAGLRGWNLRCARCGLWGARWCADARPGRDIALCDPHAADLAAERAQHQAAMDELLQVRFGQPIPAPATPSAAENRRRRAAAGRAR